MAPKLFFLLVFSFLANRMLSAQANFRPGFIVKNSGDTVSGLLDYRVAGVLSQTCSFRPNEDAEITVYNPNELNSYQFDNGKTLISKEIGDKRYFLEQLYKGCVEVYFLKVPGKDDQYFVNKPGSELVELTYSEERIIQKGLVYLKKSNDHVVALKYLMSDQRSLYPSIEQLGKPDASNLILLAKAYQKKACANQVVGKRNKSLSAALEASLGWANYLDSDFALGKNYIQAGGLIHIGSARNAGRALLRSGLLLSVLETTRGSKVVLKIPIQIEYAYTGKSLSPRVAAGVNIYAPFYQSVALTAGFNVKLKTSSFLSFNYDIDFQPDPSIAIIPSKILANTLSIGFYKNLGSHY